jgi:hypothetical protein
MRYLLMVRWVEDGLAPPPEEEAARIREHLALDQELAASGKLLESGSLQLEHTATMVRVRNGQASATDGPFAETKEHLAGFYAIEAKDRDEAVRIAARIPSARTGWIEVRPMRELEAELPLLDRRAGVA